MQSLTDATGASIFPPEVPLSTVTIGQKMGAGDFGTVKFGLWSNKAVAVKIQDNGGTATREAAMLWSLSHPNIVLLFAIARTQTKFYMILEKMDMDLFDYLQENRPPEKKIKIATQVLQAVCYLHDEKGIIHRDLKIDNIVLRDEDEVKITDFGVSVYESEGATSSADLRIGGWQSCAPEYINRDNVRYTFQADIYSVAILLYILMTQQNPYPYTDPNKDSVVNAKISQIRAGDRPIINASLPRALAPIIERAWAQNPTHRPKASELLTFLFTMSSAAQLEEMKTTKPDMPPASNEQRDADALETTRMSL